MVSLDLTYCCPPLLPRHHPHPSRTGRCISRIQQSTRRDVAVSCRGLDLRMSQQLLHHVQRVVGVNQEAGKGVPEIVGFEQLHPGGRVIFGSGYTPPPFE